MSAETAIIALSVYLGIGMMFTTVFVTVGNILVGPPPQGKINRRPKWLDDALVLAQFLVLWPIIALCMYYDNKDQL